MEAKRFSNQIIWYNAILCVLVVFSHTENTQTFTSSIAFFNNLELFLVDKIARPAVGGFFLCSGYLFYQNFSFNKLTSKLKSRFHSLILPYITWNFIYYIIRILTSKLSFLSTYYDDAVPVDLHELFQALIFYKYNPVFWFMQTLIVFVLLCPVIYMLISNKYIGLLFVLFSLFISNSQILIAYSPILGSMLNWLVLYALGGMIGIHFPYILKKQRYAKIGLLITALGTIIFYLIQLKYISIGTTLLYYLSVSGLVWFILSHIDIPQPQKWMHNTFFIYAFHFMVVRFGNKIFCSLFGTSMTIGILVFFLIPILIILSSEIIRFVLEKRTPILWKLLSGNR